MTQQVRIYRLYRTCVSHNIRVLEYIADQLHVPKTTPKVEHSKNEDRKTSFHSHDIKQVVQEYLRRVFSNTLYDHVQSGSSSRLFNPLPTRHLVDSLIIRFAFKSHLGVFKLGPFWFPVHAPYQVDYTIFSVHNCLSSWSAL